MARLARATDLVQAEIELEEVKEALRGWDDVMYPLEATHLQSDGKFHIFSRFFMGKSIMSIAMFNSKLLVYQMVEFEQMLGI